MIGNHQNLWVSGGIALLLLALSASGLAQDAPKNSNEQQTVFDKVKARFNRSEQDRRLVDKEAILVFDDATQKLSVRCPEKPLEVQYGEVQKVIFEASTRMPGSVTAAALGAGIGGLAGAAIQTGMDNRFTRSYWFYLEYKKPDGSLNLYLLETDKRASAQVIEKAKTVFGARVTITSFDEKAEEIKKNQLKDLKSKHSLDVDRENRPMPEIKPDKALVVFVCPPMAARLAAQGNQIKFHANDQVVAVNKMGTYSFVYFDPGDYLMASQSSNAIAISIRLEAGKDYYFQQDIFYGGDTGLARHSKELALYELSGTYYANWKRK